MGVIGQASFYLVLEMFHEHLFSSSFWIQDLNIYHKIHAAAREGKIQGTAVSIMLCQG